MKHRTLLLFGVAVLLFGVFAISISPALADCTGTTTQVRGHCKDDRYDKDRNGYPDAGVYVNGHYTSVYAYDAVGDWYWDLGDGRVQGTAGSVEALDQSTLTVCNYQVNYRADFGNDPFMNAGWIINAINCSGYDDNGTYLYLIVHETDPRYTGNPDWAVWGTWEYHVLVEGGPGAQGNLVGPSHAAGS